MYSETKLFLFGIVIGVLLSSYAIGVYVKLSDATPVYDAGYADGLAAAYTLPTSDTECMEAYGGEF